MLDNEVTAGGHRPILTFRALLMSEYPLTRLITRTLLVMTRRARYESRHTSDIARAYAADA